MKINIEEIKKLIASEIKSMKLDDVLDSSTISTIAMRIKNEADYNRTVASAPKGVLPESDFAVPSFNNNSFPEEEDVLLDNPHPVNTKTQEAPQRETIDVQPQIPSGSFPTDVAYAPEVSNKPAIPYEIQNKAPIKLFVFQESELVQNGEGLAIKNFATVNDPNVQKNMSQVWLDEANLKAEMYLVKFEKIGNINYDFTSNSATLSREQNPVVQQEVKPNIETPYMGVEVPTKTPDFETIAINAAKQAIQQYNQTNIQKMQEEISKLDSSFIEDKFIRVDIPQLLKEHIDWAEGQVYSGEKEVKMLATNKDQKYTVYLLNQKDIYAVDHKNEFCFKKD
jgi:hypothetical protein